MASLSENVREAIERLDLYDKIFVENRYISSCAERNNYDWNVRLFILHGMTI